MSLTNVTISEPVKQVSGRFTQRLLDNGHKFILTPPPFHAEHGPFIRKWESGTRSLCMPLSPVLRSDLLKVQNFISDRIVIPEEVIDSPHIKLKPIYLGEDMFITMSKWCRLSKFVKTRNAYESISESDFGKGEYFVTIEVSHVYIGPHHNGENCSLSLRVLSVVYKEECVVDPLDDLFSLFDTEPPPSDENSSAAKPKRGRKKKSCVGGDSVVTVQNQ